MRLDIHPFVGIDAARDWARSAIDDAAAAARARFLTLTLGQDEAYRAKYGEACSYIAAGYSSEGLTLPWLKAESVRADMSMTDTANRIKARGDSWNLVFGPRIEAERVAGKDSIGTLQTIPDVVRVARQAVKRLEEIVDPG